MRLNMVTIRRLAAIYLPAVGHGALREKEYVAVARQSLKALGYVLTRESADAIRNAEDAWIVTQAAAALLGADGSVNDQPFYINFPTQVQELDGDQLRANALLHYLGDALGVRLVPEYEAKPRGAADGGKRVALSVITAAQLRRMVWGLFVQGQPYSSADRADLLALAEFAPQQAPRIEVKENLAFLAAAFAHLDFSASFAHATDVLRYACALSDGDVSLAEPTRFRSLARAERRKVLALLESVGRIEELARHQERWKRLARHLRPSDYTSRYPTAHSLLTRIAQSQLPRTYQSRVEAALVARDVPAALELLGQRPGELARRLNELLGLAENRPEPVVEAFAAAAHQVATPVLVQLWNYFASPGPDVLPRRAVRIKSGATAVIDNPRRPRDVDQVLLATVEAALRGRANLGSVWLDRDLFSRYAVPLAVRSASTGLRAVGRGSRLPLPQADTVRFFLHWRDLPDGRRVDLDLSNCLVSEDFARTEEVAYYRLKGGGIVHSGDLTSAPNGAAEYIDVHLPTLLQRGWRYVVATVHSFTGQALTDVPQCWVGMMSRSQATKGKIYDPATVTDRMSLTSPGRGSTPFVIDLAARELLWWDTPFPVRAHHLINLDATIATNMVQLQHLVRAPVMMLDRLVGLLANSWANSPATADVVFADPQTQRGAVAPWHQERILALLAAAPAPGF